MDTVEEVKERLSVAEVVGSYLQLKQAGRNLKASCPFHQEKSASFMVSPEKGIWHCFGCHEGGDIFKFVMRMEGLDFRQALELLAGRAGVELKTSAADKASSKFKDRLHEANRWAVQYFQTNLVHSERAVNYLVKQRKLNKQIIQDFQIGFAPEAWEGLHNALQKKGFKTEELVKAGLVSARSGRSGAYDMFRGRIMLTISDAQGRPVGFTGRVLDEGMPKYLNTPQTPIYDKSRVIYGLHLAKDAIREHDEVVIVEGNMDVVASHQAGVKQVVAVSGTALTADQLKGLSKFTKNIKLAFDQDAAGLAATERAIELGQKLGLTLKMITIPGAKDPDELIQKDVKLWQAAISKAQYIVDYLFERFAKDLDLSSAVGKRQYTDRLASNVKRLADPVEQDHYIKLLAEKTGTELAAIRQKVEQTQGSNVQKREAAITPKQTRPVQLEGQSMLEESVLAINLAYPEVRMCLSDLRETDFTDPRHQDIFNFCRHGEQVGDAIAKSLPNLEDYVKILTLRGEELYSSLAPADRSFESFTLVRRLQTASSKQAKNLISQQLREAEAAGDAELIRSLLQKYQAVMDALD